MCQGPYAKERTETANLPPRPRVGTDIRASHIAALSDIYIFHILIS